MEPWHHMGALQLIWKKMGVSRTVNKLRSWLKAKQQHIQFKSEAVVWNKIPCSEPC